MKSAVIPINLLPWREELFRRRGKRWLWMLTITFVVDVLLFGIWFAFMWQQSQERADELQKIGETSAQLMSAIQQLQSESASTTRARETLDHLIQSHRQHQMWQTLLLDISTLPESMQLHWLSASAGGMQLSGRSLQASRISEYLGSRPDMDLNQLQLNADGWYEFVISRTVPELKP
ncbi:MAG TPA: hypothetical protein VKZ92_08360 [Pseudohongiella sp.]|nr:hypothetical protein [Pseudohongiella sp.]